MQQQQIRPRRTTTSGRGALSAEIDRRTPGGRALPF
jgi:hypothetical protein